MKRITLLATVGLFTATLFGTLAIAQDAPPPLGDYARQVRKQKGRQAPTGKKFDNDNLPVADRLSVVGQAPADKKPAEDEAAQKQKLYKEWQTKIQTQQNQIDTLARELDLTNREYRLRAAAFYADAGNRLRNSGSWDKEDAQFKEQLADKQKKLDEAKKQLEDLQEQARKAGVPSSLRE